MREHLQKRALEDIALQFSKVYRGQKTYVELPALLSELGINIHAKRPYVHFKTCIVYFLSRAVFDHAGFHWFGCMYFQKVPRLKIEHFFPFFLGFF